jgi:tRNA pseudouridine38-40 synthase
MRISIKFAYNGKYYHGFARQPNLETIEGAIINTLKEKGFIEDVNKSKIRYASRTDRGVSALGNVIVFNTEAFKIQDLENISIFNDILLYGYKNVSLEFNPRYAIKRIYRYHLPKLNFDYNRILSIVKVFIGEHNFSNFARLESYRDPIRIIDDITCSENKDFINIDFHAKTFLWHQIRRIISAITKVENGKLKLDEVINALKKPNDKVDFGLAPPEPLVLKDIVYNFNFIYNKKQLIKLNTLKLKIIKNIKYLHF